MTKELVTIGLIEFNSIASGILAADLMVKKAPIELLQVNPTCPGKFIVLIAGDVASVDSSMKEGLESGKHFVVDQLFLPNAHPSLIPAITGTTVIEEIDAVGIVETFSVASCIIAADAAAKESPIELIQMRLGFGLGGKGYFTMTGDLADIESSVEAATRKIQDQALIINTVIIPKPHEEFKDKLL